jgi:hypothetical protein
MRRPLKPLPDEPFQVSGLMPSDKPQYMFDDWVSCLHWSLGEPTIFAAFKADTGLNYNPPRNSIETMIDLASGSQERFLTAYVKWFNANVWGPIDGV